METEEFLEHYGVKGMKWGVRQKVPKTSSDYKQTSKYRNRHPSELTDHQLRVTARRIQLEQEYRRLNPSKIEAGHAAVKGMLAIATTAAAAYTLYHSPAGQAAVSSGRKFVTTIGERVIKLVPVRA